MRTLYVSDLDGTLLNSSQTTSDYTNTVINSLVEKGVLFSFATARSHSTVGKVTGGISVSIPISVYNGTFIVDNLTGERLVSNFFENDIKNLISDLLSLRINAVTGRKVLLSHAKVISVIILFAVKQICFAVKFFMFPVSARKSIFFRFIISIKKSMIAFFKRIFVAVRTGLNLCRKIHLRLMEFFG